MDGIPSDSTIDQKMAKMRIKNLELLKRHQEIEEDRQLAQRSDAPVDSTNDTKQIITTMRSTTKHRGRTIANQQHSQQENQYERTHRPAMRRKFENDRPDVPSQRAQQVDYNRLKRDRAHETISSQQKNTISPELLEYAYPFHYRTDNHHDADEPAYAKKLVIVNNQANCIGSGRFNQQQKTEEQGHRRREERMRRCGIPANGHLGENAEFHLDVPPMPIWQNRPMPPPPPSSHVQLLPTTINGHHTGTDHLINGGREQMEQSTYLPNFLYPSPVQSSPFNGNGTVYFTQAPSLMATTDSSSQGPLPSQTQYHQYNSTRTFENSNRYQFQHPAHFQSAPPFQLAPPPSGQLSAASHFHPQSEDSPMDLPPRFRRLKAQDYENKFSHPRPMSGDFDRSHNGHYSSSNCILPSSNDHRSQSRPQSFYDFSSQSQSNNNNNFSRSSITNRYQRNNNNTNTNASLPLSAYMNTDDSSYRNDNTHQQWGTSYSRRRPPPNQQRAYHQDKHQFPLSSYDPCQYGFANNNSNNPKRNDCNNQANVNRTNTSNLRNNGINESNGIDLIEEWWEDNNTELIGIDQSTGTVSFQPTPTVNDSGNSSLSTSMNLKESILDDEDNNRSTNGIISPPSDISTTDSNIIESLDKLQQELKLEEAMDKQLPSDDECSSDANDKDSLLFSSSHKEPTTYDTAHFMQWAKDKFREELAGRLTAQEIEQHDAVTTDDDEDDLRISAMVDTNKFSVDQLTDDDDGNDNPIDNIDELKDNLQNNLIIDDHLSKANQSIVVERIEEKQNDSS